MNELTKFLVESILGEEKKEVVALYAGGFKPPTAGHFQVIEETLKQYPEIDKLIVLVGSGIRDGIEQAESILVWEIYQNYLPMKVEIQAAKKPPVGAVYSYAKDNPEKTIYWVLGAREGKDDDLSDITKRTAAIDKKQDKYNNVEVKIITTANKGMSGTNARKALQDGDQEIFFKFIPTQVEEKEEIFNILRPAVTETSNPNDGKAAPFGSGYDEVKEQINFKSLESQLDNMFAELDIDVAFTNHFKERVIERGLTEEDIIELANKIIDKYPNELDFLDKDQNIVMSHLSRLVDIAAVNTGYGDDYLKDLVFKTAFKRKDKSEPEFRTNKSSPRLSVTENTMKGKIDILPKIGELTLYMIDNGMNVEPLPTLEIIEDDAPNAEDFFGKTAYYDPDKKHIVLYTHGRHPKDIVRSYAHEMIHHIQNLEGRLGNITTTNTQEDDSLNDIEAEANLNGTMTFRNWTDSILNENVSASSFPNSALLFGGFFTGIQRMGIGKTIISDLFKSNPKLDNLLLYTQDDAIGFWKKLGGKIIQQGEDKKGILRYFVQINRNDVDPNLNLKQLGISYKNLLTKKSKIDKGEYAIKMGKQKIGFFFVRDIGTIQMDPMNIFANNLNEVKKEINNSMVAVLSRKGNQISLYDFDNKEPLGLINTYGNEVTGVVAKKGYGPLMYELGIANVYPNGLQSDRNGNTEPGAEAVLNKFIEGASPNIEAVKLTPNDKDYKTHYPNGNELFDVDNFYNYKFYNADISILKQLLQKGNELPPNEQSNIISDTEEMYDSMVNESTDSLNKTELDEDGQKISDKNMDDYKKSNNPSGKVKDPFGLNAFSRELSMGLEEEILTEGRYDKLANQLSSIAFETIKDGYDVGRKVLDVTFTVGPDDEDIISNDFEFDFTIEVEYTDDEYKVDGGANAGFDDEGEEITPLLNVRFKIPKNIDFQEVSFDLKDVVRHELEHLTQDGENVKPGKQIADDDFIRKMINSDVLPKADYFKLEKEIDAMLQGLYFKAKKSKRPFIEVIDDYLDKQPISQQEREDILDLWRSRRGALSLPIF